MSCSRKFLALLAVFGLFAELIEGGCPKGFEGVEGRCMKMLTNPQTAEEAYTACSNLNANLAIVNTMPFVNSLNNYLNKNFTGKCTGSVYGFWTAGRRKDKTKTFYWNTAKPSIYAFNTCDCGKVANILNWASGQPDDYMSNEDCVHMYSVDGKLIANDFPCSNKVCALCQAEEI
ncbi:hypothetical protein HELRODRAFT_184445 [Helobdella robusta]|uniref:C-type lectin domain-containing protein n=1 Tax=Helobdella robusta TaxID=6412 RepID=T1FL79_HELRO|nr:hypothetical protein HELRODRAFT_184445 [Helobdella robusta]XP_009026388.1 hypothetical protein HELRODRAFT_179295 [Helobdella robusta]ESN95519.1 hypothetical protein HELRODRAFT_179295 [Helobdella robusta]ESN95869.1 hypothetical protein HELRODRAFT_184445 [Helobdella robusta]